MAFVIDLLRLNVHETGSGPGQANGGGSCNDGSPDRTAERTTMMHAAAGEASWFARRALAPFLLPAPSIGKFFDKMRG